MEWAQDTSGMGSIGKEQEEEEPGGRALLVEASQKSGPGIEGLSTWPRLLGANRLSLRGPCFSWLVLH